MVPEVGVHPHKSTGHPLLWEGSRLQEEEALCCTRVTEPELYQIPVGWRDVKWLRLGNVPRCGSIVKNYHVGRSLESRFDLGRCLEGKDYLKG